MPPSPPRQTARISSQAASAPATPDAPDSLGTPTTPSGGRADADGPRHEDSPPDADAAALRARFPRGLAQPEGGFRFGVDTLLLSAFAAARLKPSRGGAPVTGLDMCARNSCASSTSAWSPAS